MDSQPDESRPRTRKPLPAPLIGSPARRMPTDLGQAPRWKVRLELLPSEIARVYRQGLAHGAEVQRNGQNDWRPLLTAPELRAALERPASDPELGTSRTFAIGDPSLAALLLERVPSAARAPSSAPPPPPVLSPATALVRLPLDTIPDSEITLPLPTRVLPAPPADPFAATESVTDQVAPRVLHASRLELCVAAALAVVGTLLVMLVAQRALHWGEARAPIASPSPSPSLVAASVASPEPSVERAPRSLFPVVALQDLPTERALPAVARRPHVGAGRSAFAAALSRAAASARACGAGPVNAQVLVKFAPSGVPRAVGFGAETPPAAMRSCVLAAIARARVAPFEGPAVTVSKSLRW